MFNRLRITKKNTYIVIFIILILCYSIYSTFNYNSFISNFKNSFDKGNYTNAMNLFLNEGNFNIIKKIKVNKDLNSYFSDYLIQLNKDFTEKKVSEEYIASLLREIERYDLVNSKVNDIKNTLPLFTESTSAFKEALVSFNNKDYIQALNLLEQVNPLSSEYISALNYEQECFNLLKENLLSKAETLAKDKYYTKAITLLQDNLKLLKEDKDIINKIEQYEKEKKDYLSSIGTDNSKPSSVSYTVLTNDNINSFDISSATKYLIFVNTNLQRTYIYKGSKNKWELIKNYICSTGIKGEETPKGSFTIKNKGTWFYSTKYSQGGKYWVSFMDNYLFHSLPFDEDKTTVLDSTLGKPSSHGCIRLKVDEAKWIYDNIPIGSMVIIN